MRRLREFMFDASTWARRRRRGRSGAARGTGLVEHYMEQSDEVPMAEPGASECQRVADYLSGMTDRFCIARCAELTVPEGPQF